MSRNVYKGIDNTIVNNVRFFAKKLKRKPCFFNDDTEDLEQELILHVLTKLDSFEDSKGNLSTYIRSILENKSKNLMKQKMRGKGDGGGVLSVSIDDMDIENEEQLQQFFNDVILNDIEHRLHDGLRDTFKLLRNNNATNTAKILGKSKSTIYKKVHKIRRALLAEQKLNTSHISTIKKESEKV